MGRSWSRRPGDKQKTAFPRERTAFGVAVELELREARLACYSVEFTRRVNAEAIRDCDRLSTFRPVRKGDFACAAYGVERAPLESKCPVWKFHPVLGLEVRQQAITVQGLQDEHPFMPEDPPKLRERLQIALVAEEAERREEVDNHVKARRCEGQLSVVALHPVRPLGSLLAPASLGEKDR